MSASVVFVDLSSESEEESPPGAKRRRLDDPQRAAAPTGRQSLPNKLVNTPKASLGVGVGVGAVTAKPLTSVPTDPLQSMHIPSGITVTKHQKNNSLTNGNITITLTENNSNNNNNNNTHSFNNNVKQKQMKMGAAQKVAWSMSNKAPSLNALITAVPSHQVKVTPNPQCRLSNVGKANATNPQAMGVVPKAMPAKIQPPVGIGQQQQQQQQQANQQQQKPIMLSAGKAKAPMGQMLQQLQQQQKVLAVQLQQQQQQQQQKGVVTQIQQRTSLGQQQQQPQKPLGVQIQQQHKPQQQKTVVGAQHQQQPKSIMSLQQQKTIQVQVQQQQPTPKVSQVQIQQQKQPATKTSLARGQPQQQQQQKAIQVATKTPVVQPNRISMEQMQQQQYRAYLGQLQQQQQQRASIGQAQQQQQLQQRTSIGQVQQQQQRAPIVQVQPQQQQLPQGTIVGQMQGQLLVPLAQQQQQQQQKKPPGSLQQKPMPAASYQQKTQMAQQLQKAVMEQLHIAQQQQSPFLQKTSPSAVNQITHKSMTIQKLPMVQPRASPKVTSKAPPKQIIHQQTPPPAHLVQRVAPPPPGMLPNAAFPHKINPPILRPTTVAKITPVPPNSRAANIQIRPQAPGLITATPAGLSAARTLPFRSTNHKPATPPPLAATNLQGFTASATLPQRLLATPPHCAAALNEPLLLNLPPTTSITPQLTPTTTPPPTAIPAALQHQQLAKAAAFKLNGLPGASISPVTRPAGTKRIQPITVLKKSDEEWRRHMFEQQQLQQKQREQLQPATTPTIVLVESPPTTPPTEKVDTESSKTGSSGAKSEQKRATPADKKRSKVTPPVTVDPEIVDLDELPETPMAPKEKPKEAAAPPAKAPFIPEYSALLKICLEVDKSSDMERLAQGKLTKYYYSVHESFVKSRGFRKMVEMAIMRIKNESDMVYVHLKSVVDELKARRVARVREKPTKPSARDSPQPKTSTPKLQSEQSPVRTQEQDAVEEEEEEPEPEPDSPTLDKRQGERIRKLNHTLATIKKRIEMLEEADVDWNDEDSSYLQVERYKKRACQIYEKICDLTGESKSARRQLKQAIIFKDSAYPDFNRTLSAFVNRMQEFPDYHDVLQLLEHCNKDKELGLASFEMKRIAHDAFAKVGQLLQARRKTDLYETVTHFTANVKDPAASDPQLLAKLQENNKKKTKISDVLEKFAREQDLNTEERQEARLKLKQEKAAEEAAKLAALAEDDDKPCTSAQAAAKAAAVAALMNGSATANRKEAGSSGAIGSKDNDDHGEESEDETETEDEEDDVDAFVDSFKVNGEVSDDVDSEPEVEPSANEDVIDITRAETAAEKADEDPINGKLKIISVSSLNANFVHELEPNAKPSGKAVIEAEIIISDEEP